MVSTQVAKMAAIAALPRPTNVTSVKAFSGVVNYYRQFIPNCSRLQAPLNQLTNKGVFWAWGEAQEEASLGALGGTIGRTGVGVATTGATFQGPM